VFSYERGTSVGCGLQVCDSAWTSISGRRLWDLEATSGLGNFKRVEFYSRPETHETTNSGLPRFMMLEKKQSPLQDKFQFPPMLGARRT